MTQINRQKTVFMRAFQFLGKAGASKFLHFILSTQEIVPIYRKIKISRAQFIFEGFLL